MDDEALKIRISEILKDDRDPKYIEALSTIRKIANAISAYLGKENYVKMSIPEHYGQERDGRELCQTKLSLHGHALCEFTMGYGKCETYPIRIRSSYVHSYISDNWDGDEVRNAEELLTQSLFILSNPNIKLVINNFKID